MVKTIAKREMRLNSLFFISSSFDKSRCPIFRRCNTDGKHGSCAASAEKHFTRLGGKIKPILSVIPSIPLCRNRRLANISLMIKFYTGYSWKYL